MKVRGRSGHPHPNSNRVFRGIARGRHIFPGPPKAPQQTVQHPGRPARNLPRNSPNPHPWMSSPKRSATPPPSANATAPIRPPPTPSTLQQQEPPGRVSRVGVKTFTTIPDLSCSASARTAALALPACSTPSRRNSKLELSTGNLQPLDKQSKPRQKFGGRMCSPRNKPVSVH